MRTHRLGCFGFLFILILAGVVWWLIKEVSFGHPLYASLVIAVGFVALKVARRVRRTRRRSASMAAAMHQTGTVTVQARSPIGKTALHGRLAGIKDAKELVAAGKGTLPDGLTFELSGKVAEPYVTGYVEGVHEIIDGASVAYRRQGQPYTGGGVS